MKADPTSLDNLHDLVIPSAVSFWPPAPGWYVLATMLLLAIIWLEWKTWKHWQANAYRREALRQLQSSEHVDAIAEVLRRTALAVAPRWLIAAKSGHDWPEWLAAHYSEPMPEAVRSQLSIGVYAPPTLDHDLDLLRSYAARWIAGHRAPEPENQSNETMNTQPKRNFS
jgi:hypothetical protein